jgi:YggT family protein
MGNLGQELGGFLISTLFSIYILLVMLRMLFALVHADFYNPLSQAIVKLTNPPLVPLRRVLPGIGKVDTAALVLLLALQMLEVALLALLIGQQLGFVALLYIAVVKLVRLLIYVFIGAIIIQAILSWVSPGNYGNPVVGLLESLTAPLLRPLRRVIPPAGMLDLSPLVALIGLYMLLIVFNNLV